MRHIRISRDKYLYVIVKRMQPPMWTWPRKTNYFPSWVLHLGEWTVMIGISRKASVPHER